MTIQYAADKPNSCKYCYFYVSKKKGCKFGEENCYYIESRTNKMKTGECEGCPYGMHAPCIGYCMQKILKEFRHEI